MQETKKKLHIFNLREKIQNEIDLSMSRSSRIHSSNTLSSVWIKRDDELSCTISGTKWRKYLSLIPYLKKVKKTVVVTGGCYSNHVLGIAQLFIENQIPFKLMLYKPKSNLIKGNYWLLKQLTSSDVTFVEYNANHNALAKEKWGSEVLVLEEGGAHPKAILGLCTLGLEIAESGSFNHIFIDSGTGFSAAVLYWCLNFLQIRTTLHVNLIAGDQSCFDRQFSLVEQTMGKCSSFAALAFHIPSKNKSFGSISKKLISEISAVAKQEGFFLDPIYTYKSWNIMQSAVQKKALEKVLWIHSGGTLSLLGFQP